MQAATFLFFAGAPEPLLNWWWMTLDELEREYVTLRQQADAVRSYL
jgi:hypothetical protein